MDHENDAQINMKALEKASEVTRRNLLGTTYISMKIYFQRLTLVLISFWSAGIKAIKLLFYGSNR